MITPRFSLSQDDKFLSINIRAPYCNLKELEIYVDTNDFRFICAPYYLRLTLPGNIVENDSSTGEFSSENGEFTFKYAKETPGEVFEGLEFITRFLAAPKRKKNVEISVLSENSDCDQEGNDWHVEQTLTDESVISTCKYGFANQKSDVLRNIEDEFYSVFDIRNADKMVLGERKLLRFDTESMMFSSDHFLADYFDDEMIQDIIKTDCPWTQINKQTICFDDKEKDMLKDLPNKEYLLDKKEMKYVLCGLVDILYAYCYDKRTTDFESNCESGWTITKLSATLSWFDVFETTMEVLTSSFRRSLTYPLHRNFALSLTVLQDLNILLQLGPIFVVKCLIDIYNIFNTSADPRYILNDLYIRDYIIFMQKCPKNDIQGVLLEVAAARIEESCVNLDLKRLIESQLDGKQSGNILDKMAKLDITNVQSDSETEDSDSDSDSSEDSSSDSDESSSECSDD